MASSNLSSVSPSGAATRTSRFTNQASTAADLLATQTVGLVHLSDFRRRRAEALEQKEREASASASGSYGRFSPASVSGAASGTATPNSTKGGSTPQGPPPKKKRKGVAKGKLSFGLEDEERGDGESNAVSTTAISETDIPGGEGSIWTSSAPPRYVSTTSKKRIGPAANLTITPKALTKSALLRDAQTREHLRKEFLSMQETVKSTEIIIPFVFYDGTNIPGGACKVKKSDYVWLFLDRSRKVGAELGVGGGGEKAKSRNEWARVGVDDLMLVRGEVIIPHHYQLYYFIVNKTLGPNSIPLFDYAATTTPSSTAPSRSQSPSPDDYDPISLPSSKTKKTTNTNGQVTPADRNLEGANDDPNFTKVVDRRWYERNKHIFPASVWEEFDPGKDYAKGVRKDAEGNAFFFS